MRAVKNGSIINVTSITVSVGIGRYAQALYAATKGGLEALTREWAAQWSRHGIRVNSLAPDVLETEFTATVLQVPEFRDWVLEIRLSPGTASRGTWTGHSCSSPVTLAGTSQASA
jgi:NAD(P)-dependent dehydrogenase (short-subunit alcohol dehydrogenase family)